MGRSAKAQKNVGLGHKNLGPFKTGAFLVRARLGLTRPGRG